MISESIADIDESIENSDVVETFVFVWGPRQFQRSGLKAEVKQRLTRQKPIIDASLWSVLYVLPSICLSVCLLDC